MTDELPPGWAPVQLREVVEILDNKRIPINNAERTKRLSSSTKRFPYYGATGQVGEIDDFIFEGEAILLGEDGAPFFDAKRSKAYIVDGRYWVNNHAHILRGKDGVSNRFLCHQLNRIDYRPYVAGTTRLKLTQGAMSDIQLVLAPSHEQERIASKIDELFSRIDEGERALERVSMLVERYRQSVLKAAVTGELTRAWREKNKDTLESGEALLARILTARREAWEKAELEKMKAKGITPANDTWKQKYEAPSAADSTGLPKLPSNWTWASAEAVCSTVHSGSTPERPLLQGSPSNGVPFIKVYNLTFDGSLDFTVDPTYVDAEHHRKHMSRSRTLPGDVLTNIVGPPLGKVSVVPPTSSEWNINQAVVGFRPLTGVRNDLFSLYLQSEVAKRWLRSTTKTTTSQVNLAVTTCRRLPIPIPPEPEQDRICEIVEKSLSYADDLLVSMRGASSRSSWLRQSALKAAFSGQLVNQDPADEPASTLLARIAGDHHEDTAAPKPGRKKKSAA